MTIKFCTKCGKQFYAIGREVICPDCKAAAAEDAKRAAVLKAKRASWSGESVPVRISGRASTVIREYGKANNIPFAESLDELLKASSFFQTTGKKWEEVEPYRSHRRDKRTTEDATETPQGKQDAPQASKQAAGKQNATEKPQEAPQEAGVANKNTTSTAAKKAVKTTSKASASKAAGKAATAAKKGGKA